MFKDNAWRETHTARVNAKICIEDALRKYYDGCSLDKKVVEYAKDCVSEELVSEVLAYNLLFKAGDEHTAAGSDWAPDDRISTQNLTWAKTVSSIEPPVNEQEELCRISWLIAADVRLLDRFASLWISELKAAEATHASVNKPGISLTANAAQYLLISSINGCLDIDKHKTLAEAQHQLLRELSYTVGIPVDELSTNVSAYQLDPGHTEAYVNNDDDLCSWVIYEIEPQPVVEVMTPLGKLRAYAKDTPAADTYPGIVIDYDGGDDIVPLVCVEYDPEDNAVYADAYDVLDETVKERIPFYDLDYFKKEDTHNV